MDAIKFLKEKERMCESGKCSLNGSDREFCRCECNNLAYEKLVEIVDDWSENNPAMTNKDKFKEVFGFEFFSKRAKTCINYGRCDDVESPRMCISCQWWSEPYANTHEC